MKNRLLPIFFGLLLPVHATAATDFQPFAGPDPELVWIESNPWAMIIGSDTPQFVLYTTGQVIYGKLDKDQFTYHSCVLDQNKLKEIAGKVSAVVQDKSLKQWYSLVQATDQPIASFYIQPTQKAKPAVVEAYGMDFPGQLSRAIDREKKLYPADKRDELPPDLVALDDYLGNFDVPSCPVWQPQYIEVMIWPFDNAKTAPVTWPSDWPGLGSARTIARHDKQYSIFLDGNKLPELEKLLDHLFKDDGGGALLLDGKKWAVGYRPVIPSEPVWRSEFDKLDAQH